MKNNRNDSSVVFEAATETYHHALTLTDKAAKEYQWENGDTIPFDELIISWNAMRPQYGGFNIYVSIKVSDWTPWYAYAYWGCNGQWGGGISSFEHSLEINQDTIFLLNGRKATGFRVRVEPSEEANLEDFYSIHACASRIDDLRHAGGILAGPSIDLKVPLVSQMALHHTRNRDMCSPASTSAAISYLLKKNRLDPIAFALQAHDDLFDIFGNWVLNTAHAASVMGKGWRCWVQRLPGFDSLYKFLQEGYPVVVSVKGPLPGSPLPYKQGHLIVVKGYDATERQVLCMDPAFPDDQSTDVRYELDDFVEAWSRRHFVAYIFKPCQEG